MPAEPDLTATLDPDAPGWRRRPPGADGRRNDLGVAVALFLASLLTYWLYQVAGVYDEPAPGWASVLCLAVLTLPLAARRRHPAAVAVVVAVAYVVLTEARVPEVFISQICLFLSIYTVGAWDGNRRRSLVVRLVVIVGMFAWLVVALFRATNDPEALADFSRAGAFSPLVAFLLLQLLTNVVYFGAAFWFGEHAWSAARQRARTELRTVQLEAERRRVAEQAVSLERLRLARELHDAVAHHVSLMGVQASAARTLLDVDRERAGEALDHVSESARSAISELQGVLRTLRDTESQADDAVGSLGLERLPALVDEARAAGLPTEFRVVGEERPVPPLVSLNLYRIAQEALTNTRKHAGPRARADVRLRYLPDGVEVEVADDGVGARATSSTGGMGLIGMRERVASDGGTLVAGARTRGGFLVRAHVPLPPADRPVGADEAGGTTAGAAAGTEGSDAAAARPEASDAGRTDETADPAQTDEASDATRPATTRATA